MSENVFRNIIRFTNCSTHFITIELQIEEHKLTSWCPLTSETFSITDTDQCRLQLTVNSETLVPYLKLCDIRNFEEVIKSFAVFIFNGKESIVHGHHVTKSRISPEQNLLQGFNGAYTRFSCPLKFLVYLETQNAEAKSDANSYDEDQVHYLRQLSLDFLKLHDQNIDTDITLNVGNVNMEAHKAVLRARSPVFNKMFEHDTSESTDNVICIKEISAPVIKEFLAFLYTGVKKNHEFNIVRELYYVADKYEVPTLRDACKKDLLSHHLNDDRACEMLILADQHGDESFKEAVVEFINENFKSVIKKKEFEDLTQNYPKLALTLMRNYCDESSK